MSLDIDLSKADGGTVFSANITHNLRRMATAAGIGNHFWFPDEVGITTAQQLVGPTRAAIELMKSDPARFEALNAENGWGKYRHFLPWLEKCLAAFEMYPDAAVSVSR